MHQSTRRPALMAMAVVVILLLITRLDSIERHSYTAEPNAELNFAEPNFADPLEFWSRAIHPQGTSDIPRFFIMPRARGKPRRGAAWYTAESRRQRQKKFEQALALASSRRHRKSGKPRMPPMAYVEEITLDEAMQSYLKLPLFTVPDNWNPPTDFGTDDKILPSGKPLGSSATRPAEEFTTCYVEEETLSCAKGKNDPPTGAPLEEATQLINRQVHQDSEAHAGEGATGPFPLASAEGNWQDQHPFTNPGYLALIFDMRSMLDDQIFCIARIDHRLDMLFAAHSRTLPKRQCPTCVQAYAFPAGWRRHGDEDEPAG
jgi:hypothetical protein